MLGDVTGNSPNTNHLSILNLRRRQELPYYISPRLYENAQFKDWKDKEGDLFKEREVLNALHLYFSWLSLTLQRSAGSRGALCPRADRAGGANPVLACT